MPYEDFQAVAQGKKTQADHSKFSELKSRAKSLGKPSWPEFARQITREKNAAQRSGDLQGFSLKHSA